MVRPIHRLAGPIVRAWLPAVLPLERHVPAQRSMNANLTSALTSCRRYFAAA